MKTAIALFIVLGSMTTFANEPAAAAAAPAKMTRAEAKKSCLTENAGLKKDKKGLKACIAEKMK